MRDMLYADNRDLVKWGVLLQLAERYQAENIFQVAYWRPTDWKDLEIEGERFPIPQSVFDHFRDIQNIEQIKRNCQISVFDCTFQDRRQYAEALRSQLAKNQLGCTSRSRHRFGT